MYVELPETDAEFDAGGLCQHFVTYVIIFIIFDVLRFFL